MKIEFLDDIGKGDKDAVPNRLVRLYDFDVEEATEFRNAIADLVREQKNIHIHRLPFVKAVNCSLELSISDVDLGIIPICEGFFECKLTKVTYLEMINLIQHLIDEDLNGYQWLYNNMCEIDFLFSPGGGW